MRVLFGSDKNLVSLLKLSEGDIKNLETIVCFDIPSDDLKA